VPQLGLVTVLVDDYDRALDFYVGRVGFDLVDDTEMDDGRRWVVVAPPGATETGLLLAVATTPAQAARIGDQAGGRVWLFLETDDLARDRARMLAAGVTFEEEPREEPYGIVAVWRDCYGNRWDLVQPGLHEG
jgi:catechol 2,3-dioxygenase-like lactoylglutathione lyase family enzyme